MSRTSTSLTLAAGAALAAASLFASDAAAQTAVDLLPRRPEVVVREAVDGTPRFTVRGRDCAIEDILAVLRERGRLEIVRDDAAEKPLRSTLATVELYERRPDQIVELLAAAAGVDVDIDAESGRFKLLGPSLTSGRPRLRVSLEQFYRMSLSRQADAETAARSLRGLADVLRKAGDFASAYAAYEQLLADHQGSPFAVDSELLLADCYIQLEHVSRANDLLRGFLSRCSDPKRAELALRRLLSLLLAQRRYDEVVTLHEAFERIGKLSPETLTALSDAAAVMLEESDADVTLLLRESFRRHPVDHAMLGPVLGLAFARRGEHEASRKVLEKTAESMGTALDSTAALLAYGELSRRAGQLDAALLLGHRAVAVAKDNPILERRAHLLLADVFEALGVASRTYHHLWLAEQLSSAEDAPRLALRAADLALAHNEPEHARLLFQSAAQYSGAGFEARLGVARALLAADDPRRALDALENLAAETAGDPERRRIELLASECFVASGRLDLAIQVIEQGNTVLLGGAP
jgi:tetratricopeptide (TPR) repeat protein